MGIVRKILGPKSKYDKELPYTYEARMSIIDGEEEYNAYLADTICGLVEYLDDNNIEPDEVQLFEIYQERETAINMALFTSGDNKWLFRPEMCESFKEHYKGHIHDHICSFADRDRKGSGP